MLKYEKLAQVGDKIRAMDHQDGGYYIEGIVVKRAQTNFTLAYEIYVMVDTTFPGVHSRVGRTAMVPFETDCDYDGRVTRLSLEDEDVTELTITQTGAF